MQGGPFAFQTPSIVTSAAASHCSAYLACQTMRSDRRVGMPNKVHRNAGGDEPPRLLSKSKGRFP